jgi:hypothetical protein
MNPVQFTNKTRDPSTTNKELRISHLPIEEPGVDYDPEPRVVLVVVTGWRCFDENGRGIWRRNGVPVETDTHHIYWNTT